MSLRVAYCFQEYTDGYDSKAYSCDLYRDVHVHMMTMNDYDKTSLRFINWDKGADDM